MASIVKCDCCGKVIEGDDCHYEVSVSPVWNRYSLCRYDDDYTLDVCSSCMSKQPGWLRNNRSSQGDTA